MNEATTTEPVSMPPVVCTPWCVYPSHFTVTGLCESEPLGVPLSLEAPAQRGAELVVLATVGALGATEIWIDRDGVDGGGSRMTVDEARQLIEAPQLAIGQVGARNTIGGLRTPAAILE